MNATTYKSDEEASCDAVEKNIHKFINAQAKTWEFFT